MWGWEDSACALCGAPYCMCDCNKQLETMNEDLKAIRGVLIDDLRRARAESGIRRDYVSPDFLTALRCQGTRRSLLRALAVEIPEVIIHESFFMGEIGEEEMLEIQHLRDEANAPWYVRAWRKLNED